MVVKYRYQDIINKEENDMNKDLELQREKQKYLAEQYTNLYDIEQKSQTRLKNSKIKKSRFGHSNVSVWEI